MKIVSITNSLAVRESMMAGIACAATVAAIYLTMPSDGSSNTAVAYGIGVMAFLLGAIASLIAHRLVRKGGFFARAVATTLMFGIFASLIGAVALKKDMINASDLLPALSLYPISMLMFWKQSLIGMAIYLIGGTIVSRRHLIHVAPRSTAKQVSD